MSVAVVAAACARAIIDAISSTLTLKGRTSTTVTPAATETRLYAAVTTAQPSPQASRPISLVARPKKKSHMLARNKQMTASTAAQARWVHTNHATVRRASGGGNGCTAAAAAAAMAMEVGKP